MRRSSRSRCALRLPSERCTGASPVKTAERFGERSFLPRSRSPRPPKSAPLICATFSRRPSRSRRAITGFRCATSTTNGTRRSPRFRLSAICRARSGGVACGGSRRSSTLFARREIGASAILPISAGSSKPCARRVATPWASTPYTNLSSAAALHRARIHRRAACFSIGCISRSKSCPGSSRATWMQANSPLYENRNSSSTMP